MNISDAVTALATLLIACAAWGATIAAWKGLGTWQDQAKWQADRDLARRILVSVYNYRNSLYSVRHPAMPHAEMELDPKPEIELTASQRRSQGVVQAYARRWEKHRTSRVELDTLLIEADALWGKELSEIVKSIKSLEHELYIYIVNYLDANYREDQELAAEYQKILKKKRDILYDSLDDEKDEFRKDFLNALEPVEHFLANKLGRAK
ncbi:MULTISPECIES: hypothetical protein [unclassified Sulfitobacter]|uniref:hypothetical protein n=1 Tax=unclassified Sulfitobacter TaxID=196795 RepID=UPI0022AED4BF|nr:MULTISPECIES: hypothetical protein [unclassified Sulfitobacter]MCZ4257518.1 hypothetical protein [Sulfitobacter sp. G21635-S1]